MGCFSSKSKKKAAPDVQPTTEVRLSTPPALASVDSARSPVHLIILQSPPSRISVKSRFSLQDVQSADFTPHSTSRQVYKYNCPICLKYLTTVLVSSCCRNYICHFCVEDLKAREGDIRCPMCNLENVTLEDVDPTAAIKRYSDSPFSTRGAGRSTQGQGKWVSTLAVVEEDRKLAQEFEQENSVQSIPVASLPPGDVVAGLAVTA